MEATRPESSPRKAAGRGYYWVFIHDGLERDPEIAFYTGDDYWYAAEFKEHIPMKVRVEVLSDKLPAYGSN